MINNELTNDKLLAAYAGGYFPMGRGRHGKAIDWYYPERRGVLPLDTFHVPKSLKKFLKAAPFTYTVNHNFRQVMEACAERPDGTWINDAIIDAYCKLHAAGHAHSVECWSQDDARPAGRASYEPRRMEFSEENSDGKELVGGLYGVSLAGAFFGESMFSRAPNASKAALVYLVSLLRDAGYTLLDTQYVNDHLKQFGVLEIPRDEYLKRLEAALLTNPNPAFL